MGGMGEREEFERLLMPDPDWALLNGQIVRWYNLDGSPVEPAERGRETALSGGSAARP